jgi:antitoxin component YwqK of YwqJK toxin-antitoxin module
MRITFCIVIAIAIHANLQACSCNSSLPVSVEYLTAYDLVFLGKVTSVKKVKDPDGDLGGTVATFSVTTWILPKQYNTTVSIYTNPADGRCGREFNVGDVWLMATGFDKFGMMRSSICDGSVMKDGKEDAKFESTVEYFKKLMSFNGSLREKYKVGERSYVVAGVLKNGLPDGRWTKTIGTDTLAIWNFKDGRRHGYEMIRMDQRQDIVTIRYHEVDDHVVSVYSQNKRLIERYHVVNGVRHGKYKSYSADGEPWITVYYIHGRIEGQLTRWRLSDEKDRPYRTSYLFRNDRLVRKERVIDEG